MQAYLASPDGRQKYEQTYVAYCALYKATEPHRYQQAAHAAAIVRIERFDFCFPEYAAWAPTNRDGGNQQAA